MKKISRFNIEFLILLLIGSLYNNLIISNNAVNQNFTDQIESWANSMIETLHLVNSKSYYPIGFDDSMIKALDAFVKKDSHSRFLGPKDYNDLIKSTKGEFYGIGVILGPKRPDDEFLTILEVIPDSPSYNKGLQKFDKIIAIDSKPVNSLTVDDAVKLLKAEKRYSPVELTILRDSKSVITIVVERDIVKEEHLAGYHFKNQNITYLALSMFSEKTAQRLENFIKKINLKNPKGLILDLRNNPGGILTSAVDCASLFLGKDKLIVSTKDKNQKIQEELYTSKDKIIKDIPIIILINDFTASAAEILAGALRAYSCNNLSKDKCNPHIFLLGTISYGKGSVQEVIPISNDCALKLTTSLYYLPDNKSIDCKGIEPDFYVDQKFPPSNDLKLLHKIYGKERRNLSEKVKLDNQEKDYFKKKIEFIKNDCQIQAAANLILLLDLGLRKSNKLCTRQNSLKFLSKSFIGDKTLIEHIN